jgi:hypothetical protein
METINQFNYIYANISLYQFHSDWIIFAITFIGGITLM